METEKITAKSEHSAMNSYREDRLRRFVLECETDFEKRLSKTSEEVCSASGIRFITLSGPTCSGKTTAAKKIVEDIEKRNKRAHVISIDDFYYDKEILHQRTGYNNGGKIDYDSVNTIDLDTLGRFVEDIYRYEEIFSPIFDFKSGQRAGTRKLTCKEQDIFIFEGIQALYPEVTSLFGDKKYVSVYIAPQRSVSAGARSFEPNELRFLRRIVRDENFRGTSAEFTFELWKSVRENEEAHIFPYVDACMFKIDSSFDYEIGILKPYLMRALSGISPNSKFRAEADSIIEKISGAEEIPVEYLSPNSLYREFV